MKAQVPTYTTRATGGTKMKFIVCAGNQNMQLVWNVGTIFFLHSSNMSAFLSIALIIIKKAHRRGGVSKNWSSSSFLTIVFVAVPTYRLSNHLYHMYKTLGYINVPIIAYRPKDPVSIGSRCEVSTRTFFVMVCWVNSAPVMSVPYTTALEAIGYFLKSAFTAMDTLLTMDMMLAMSTWNCVKLCKVVTVAWHNQYRSVAVLCPLSAVKIQEMNTVF